MRAIDEREIVTRKTSVYKILLETSGIFSFPFFARHSRRDKRQLSTCDLRRRFKALVEAPPLFSSLATSPACIPLVRSLEFEKGISFSRAHYIFVSTVASSGCKP